MSAAAERGECQRLDRWLSAYVDDELDAIHCIEVEEHVGCCSDCAELVATLRATRTSLKRALKVSAPTSLRERLSQSLGVPELAEQAPTSQQPAPETASTPPPGPALVKLRYVLPLAAAATLALVLGASQLGRQMELSDAAGSGAPTAANAASFDGLIDELVRQHIQPLPPETDDPEQLSKFEPHIGVRLQRPRMEEARFVGARMQQNAALMQYVLRNRHRVSVYVFDPQRVPLRASRLQPRHIGNRSVFVGHVRGYSVAASESADGIGYALASDLTDDESAKLLVSASR